MCVCMCVCVCVFVCVSRCVCMCVCVQELKELVDSVQDAAEAHGLRMKASIDICQVSVAACCSVVQRVFVACCSVL